MDPSIPKEALRPDRPASRELNALAPPDVSAFGTHTDDPAPVHPASRPGIPRNLELSPLPVH